MAGGGTHPTRTVVGKVALILGTFPRGGRHTVTELAKLTGLPLSTVHRLVYDLADGRVLQRCPDGSYRPGALFSPPRDPAEEHPATVLDRAVDVLDDLARATGGTARFGVLAGAQVHLVARAASTAGARRHVVPVSPHTALGTVLLAHAPAAVVDQVLGRTGGPFGRHRDARHRRPAAARAAGAAPVTAQLTERASSIAAPVLATGGPAVGAVELVARSRPDLAATRAALLVAAGSLARELARDPAATPGRSAHPAAG
jgi:DNA-binding IclR family transcriptional regulator